MTYAATPLLSTIVPFDPATSHLSVVTPPHQPGPATVSASEMSRLTGVERERLRTWERRHGFPVPVRSANNVRRYRAEDVRRVATIARASAQGVPLARAVAEVLAAPALPEPSVAPGMAMESLQRPALAVRGPRPLEVVWRNGAADTAPGAPLMGADLGADPSYLGPAGVEVLRRLMAGELVGEQRFVARDWTGGDAATVTVTAWLIDAPGGTPTAILAQLPQENVAAQTAIRTDAEPHLARWAQATAAGRDTLRQHRGLAGLQLALSAAATSLDASDAALALTRGEELRLARSIRGSVAPQRLALTDAAELREVARGCSASWLGLRSAAALKVDPRSRTLAIPVTVADSTVGVVLLMLREERPLCSVAQELLLGLGAAFGASLERERAVRLTASAA